MFFWLREVCYYLPWSPFLSIHQTHSPSSFVPLLVRSCDLLEEERCSGFWCFHLFMLVSSNLCGYPPVIFVVADFQIGSLSGHPVCWWWSHFCFLVFLLTFRPLCCGTAEVHSRPSLPADHLQQLQNSKGCYQFLLLYLSQTDTHQMSVWSLLYEVTFWIYRDQGTAWGDSLSFIRAQVLSCELHCSFRAAGQVRLSLLQQNS